MAHRLSRKNRHFSEFLKVLKRQGHPSYLPFYEHRASASFIAKRTGTHFDRMTNDFAAYWKIYADFWVDMGYDCVPMSIPFDCRIPHPPVQGAASGTPGFKTVLRTMEDFERYAWPDASPIDFSHFHVAGKFLPEGVKLVAGVSMGLLDCLSRLLGTLDIAPALDERPDLLNALLARLKSMYVTSYRQLAAMDAVGALQFEDMPACGASALLPHDLMKRIVLPIYKEITDAAHQSGKPLIFHTAGMVAAVHGELIGHCGVDAIHAFDDATLPATEFKQQYGARVTALGGISVERLRRSSPPELRAYAQVMIERCFGDRYWALGTAHILNEHIPVENYIAILEEGLKIK